MIKGRIYNSSNNKTIIVHFSLIIFFVLTQQIPVLLLVWWTGLDAVSTHTGFNHYVLYVWINYAYSTTTSMLLCASQHYSLFSHPWILNFIR